MSTTASFILSLVGAAAWLPPIFTWIREKYFNKPVISIIPDKFLEIGYSVNGPIININMAFSSKNADSLIDEVTIKLRHEKNDTRIFFWEWFEEEIMQVENPDNYQIIPYKKHQRAIAIKVLEENLVEKKIGFHELDYKKEYKKYFQPFIEKYNIINKIDEPNKLLNFKNSSEYVNLLDFIKSSSFWKIGSYELEISVRSKESKKLLLKI